MATIEMPLADLRVGELLLGDVVDPSGNVLLGHGVVLGSEAVDSWLKRGFAKVLIREFDCLAQYNHTLIKELDDCRRSAVAVLDDVIVGICMREQMDTAPLDSVLTLMARLINNDADAAVHRLAKEFPSKQDSKSQALAKRSLALATIGTTTGLCLGLSTEQCKLITLAGMLHDISLFEEPLANLSQNCVSNDERDQLFMNHALNSAELLASIRGISDQVRVIIGQVHEQIDGSGFPKRLTGRHLAVPSRVLNIVDAYLTLIDESGPALVPSDAMCYLVHHTAVGSFDVDCTKGLLAATSLYPVGSEVQMTDSTLATVYRSTRTDPLRPIVQTQKGELVDLRSSDVEISGPRLSNGSRRLHKAEMNEVLWKPPYAI